MAYTPKHLTRWTMPDNYFGAAWPDYFGSGFGQHRDSDALVRSNFITALKALGGESETVIIVREGHWAVGWVEWIAIHQDNATALEIADGLKERESDYPVLDEQHFSDLEYTEAADYWAGMSVRERASFLIHSRCGASLFAARRGDLPSDDNGALMESLRG